MAWTTPATIVPNQVIGASDWNTQVRDNLSYLFSARPIGRPAVRNQGSNYSTTSTSFVDVDATNLIITTQVNSGRVIVFATGLMQTATSGVGVIEIVLDGTTYSGHATYGLFANTQVNTIQTFCAIAYFSGISVGSHTFKLQAKSTAGTTVTIFNTNSPISMTALEV